MKHHAAAIGGDAAKVASRDAHATGVAGLELLGAQDYVQSLFYGVVLVVAVVVSRVVNRQRPGLF
jgi:hypothetical protein